MRTLSEKISALALQDEQLLREALEALQGFCSRVGGAVWHERGCNVFRKPYGECTPACIQARAAITKLEERLK